jgi:hypothetical protein
MTKIAPKEATNCLLTFLPLVLLATTGLIIAQTPVDEETPWPRTRSTNGNSVTLHLPHVERWTSNWFIARAVVEVKAATTKKEILGVVWFEAKGTVDRSNRFVTLDRMEITKARFPEAKDSASNTLAIVHELFPGGARTVSLDYLMTTLGFAQAATRRGNQGLKHTPPEVVWTTNRAVLVLIAGEPVLRPITNSPLERVVNTPALMIHSKMDNKFYLFGESQSQWFGAGSLKGPWSLVQSPPAEVAALSPDKPEGHSAEEGETAPRIIISTRPAELLMTKGLPDFRSIRGTALQYAADSDNQLFFHSTEKEAYLLLSGRWFKASSLQGPWTYVAPHDLPADFGRIPANSPQAVVLASVPDTPQAELAMVANSVPTLATVSRTNATIELIYDGEPKFKPIESTGMRYAVNAQLPVIQAEDSYYAVDDSVWFVGASPTGPWQVATEVPEEIYTIPPSSPVYYATFAHVYDSDEENVEVGYTPGYLGAYEDEGTMVYGTGWDYEPWSGDEYYGWGWTWGYGYVYVPWYQWWVWRPWWNGPGGLRAAVVENIYDRWRGRDGIVHYDRPAGAATAGAARFAGYPALYGRFKGARGAVSLAPPANTLMLNPYSRPASSVRAGEIPHGAQLLSNVRRAPSGGRDLYASPDGNIYRRKDNGWYRREAGGGWSFYAPTQGRREGEGLASARGGAASGAGAAYRPAANGSEARGQNRGNRVPDTGLQARAQEVAALEREYYARSLAQVQARSARSAPSARSARPARSAGGRR